MRIYLAGAASKKYEAKCRLWRETATDHLEKSGFEVINPIKGYPINKAYSRDEMFDIVENDLISVASCDIVLAEVGTLPYQYVGTSMEILFAYQKGIPVVVWSPLKDNFFLIYHSTIIYDNLKDSIKHCIRIKEAFEEDITT